MATEFSWETYWRHLLERNGAATPGWVALMLLPNGLPLEGLAALHRELLALVGDEKVKPYQVLFHIAPTSLKDELGEQMDALAKQLGAEAPPINLETIVSSTEALVNRMVAMPKQTVVVVHSLELFHGRLGAQSLPTITTWSGTGVTINSKDERLGMQVGMLLESLVPLAESRRLLIIAHCGLSSAAAGRFSPALREEGNFVVCGSSRLEDRCSALLSRLLARMNAGTISVESARARVRRAISELELRAQAETHVLFAAKRFDEAWRVLEPQLDSYKNAPAAECFAIARMAHTAFHHHYARDWLHRGAETGPRSFIDLHSAWLLALELDEAPLAESLFARLTTFYPDDPFVLQELAKSFLRAWRYADAADYARRAGLHFYAAVWDALGTEDFDLDSVLRFARNDEDRAYIHLRAAMEAERHDDIESAGWYAKAVPHDSEFSDQAIALRLRMFGNGLLYEKLVTEADLDELMPLLAAVAATPIRMKSRMALEEITEEVLGEQTVVILLSTACERLLAFAIPAADRAPRAVLFPLTGGELEGPEEMFAFSKELRETAIHDVLKVGHGDLPSALMPRATPEMIRALTFITQGIASTDFDSRIAVDRLWEMELVCRAVGDPSKDGLVAMLLVRGLVRQGANQAARDLAEETLRVFPNSQNAHRLWRTGLAWMVVAEAFHRSGNLMAALRCAALMLTAWQSSVREAEIFCEGLNMLGKIYRDLRLTPLAMRCWQKEMRLRILCGATELIWQLDALMLDIEGQLLTGARRSTWFRYFLKLVRAWRQLPEHAEQVPLLSRAIGIGRHLRKLGVTLPAHLEEELICSLSDESVPLVAVLRRTLGEPPTRDEFLEIVRRFDYAVRGEDLKTQISALRTLAEDTLEAAVRDGDADRFIAAFGVVAQPVLTLSATVPVDAIESDIANLHRHALEEISVLDHGAIVDMDAVLKRVNRPQQRSIASACEITAAEFAASLKPDESALLLAHSGSGDLCACQICQDGSTLLWIAPAESWSEQKFHKWQRRFPASYEHGGAPGAAGWNREQLRATLAGLDLYLPDAPPKITIIPAAELFLFPFALGTRWFFQRTGGNHSFLLPAPGEAFLGEESFVSVAPSPQWLIAKRGTAPSTRSARTAWVGSPQTHDPVIKELREALQWQFAAHGIELIENERPISMMGGSLAILLAHGERGEGREFHALGDGINKFSPAEVANWVEGCACVIVAACHAGVATGQRHSHETRGLVSAILSAGVKTVIACPWPLGADVIRAWFPGFLQSISSGASVVEAASVGSHQVSKNVSDAAAPFAMQVFGDGLLQLPPIAPSEH